MEGIKTSRSPQFFLFSYFEKFLLLCVILLVADCASYFIKKIVETSIFDT